jgi:transcriptional regulator of acetoin/glycerol metabolism
LPEASPPDLRRAAWEGFKAPYLHAAGGSVTQAARLAGISRSTWYRRR